MFDTTFILLSLGMLILVGGLFYTLKLGRLVQARQSEFDTQISDKIQKHPVMLNPVFLAYVIGIGLIILYMLYHVSISK